MNRHIKILVVCGFGIGTSLILRMNIEKIIKKNSIACDVENTDLTTAISMDADIIFTSNEIYEQLKDSVKCDLVTIDNFVDENEIEKKLVLAVKNISNKGC